MADDAIPMTFGSAENRKDEEGRDEHLLGHGDERRGRRLRAGRRKPSVAHHLRPG
jgi:hypothetical protein